MWIFYLKKKKKKESTLISVIMTKIYKEIKNLSWDSWCTKWIERFDSGFEFWMQYLNFLELFLM